MSAAEDFRRGLTRFAIDLALAARNQGVGLTDAGKLEIACAKLRELAQRCPDCGGRGEVLEVFEAYPMTDDPRIWTGRMALSKAKPRAHHLAIGGGLLRTPCPECIETRQVVEILGGRV